MQNILLAALLSLAICIGASESDPACASPTATISSQSDVITLASSCPTLSGSLALATTITGGISLEGINAIGGDLLCNEIPGLTTLSVIDLTASNVFISGTGLTSLTYTNTDSVGSVEITGNTELNSLSLSFSNLQILKIASNGDDLSAEFPQLLTAGNASLSGCKQVLFPDLATVTDSLSVTGNQFDSFEIDKLTTVGENLIISNNADLTRLSGSSLTSVGGTTQVSDNPQLVSSESAFPLLREVVENIVTPPPLESSSATTTSVATSTTSATTLESSVVILTTSSFASSTQSSTSSSIQTAQSSTVSGNSQTSISTPTPSQSNIDSISSTKSLSTGISTASAPSTSTDATSLPSDTSSKVSKSQLSTAAKAGIGIGVAVGLALIIGIIVILYHCSSRQKQLPLDQLPRTVYHYPELTVPPPMVQRNPARRSVNVTPPVGYDSYRGEEYSNNMGQLTVSTVQLRPFRPRHPLEDITPLNEKAELAAEERKREELQPPLAELSAADVARVSRIHELYGSERFKN